MPGIPEMPVPSPRPFRGTPSDHRAPCLRLLSSLHHLLLLLHLHLQPWPFPWQTSLPRRVLHWQPLDWRPASLEAPIVASTAVMLTDLTTVCGAALSPTEFVSVVTRATSLLSSGMVSQHVGQRTYDILPSCRLSMQAYLSCVVIYFSQFQH